MKFIKLANKYLHDAVNDVIWNKDDVAEVDAVYGGTVEFRLSLSDCDYYIIYDDGGIISVMSVDDDGSLTYFTTEHIKEIDLKSYIRFFKEKIELYQDLFDITLSTEVWKEYKQAIRFLEILGFSHTYTDGDILTYGKQKENNI